MNNTTATTQSFINEVNHFVEALASGNSQTLIQLLHIPIGIVLIPILVTYIVGALIHRCASAGRQESLNDPFVDDVADALERKELEEAAKMAPFTDAVWQIGVSNRAVAVSEESTLRAIEFSNSGKLPAVDEIITAFLKAIVRPSDNGEVRRPRTSMVLSTRMISEATVTQVARSLKSIIDVRVASQEDLEEELPQLLAQRQAELDKIKSASPPAPPAALLPTPKRACFVCKNEITGKPRQCSACKAIIYCSPECATKDWPNHKVMCATYKSNMLRLNDENLHDLPFDYYNCKKPLDNFNQVQFLVMNQVHNVGVYRRLCQCYVALQWGEISGELCAQQAITDSIEDKFKLLGLPEELFPLSKPLPAGIDPDTINSWESWYNAVGLPLSSPVALVFDVPLTVFFIVKSFAPVRIVDGRRKLTIHMLGPEREADLVHLYEALLPLFPKTDIILHLIGPSISKRLRPEHTSYVFHNDSSTISVALHSSEYGPNHYDGSALGVDSKKRGGKPDIVIALNAAVFQYTSWFPTVKMLVETRQRTVFTEPIETTVEILAKSLAPLNASLAFPVKVNPFRQPVFQWKKEVNLPGWSSGFITGLGDFSQ